MIAVALLPRRPIMPQGAARLKGAARRCATGLRPARDPGRPLQKQAAAGARGGMASAAVGIGIGPRSRSPGPAAAPPQARHLVDTGAGGTDKQGSPILRWAVVEAIQRQPATSPVRGVKDRIIARRGTQAKNIAKTAAARHLLTAVFYAMRDGHVRSLAAHAAAQDAA